MGNRTNLLNHFMNESQLCACANLRKAVRAVSQLYDDAFRPIGLRATQFGLLGATGMLGPAIHLDQHVSRAKTRAVRWPTPYKFHDGNSI